MKPLSGAVIKARAAALRTEGDRALETHLRARIGRRVDILSERGGVGRMADFTPVKTPGVPPGRLFGAVVNGFSQGSLDVTRDSR
jgi:threonylcarbamoyladenosine tRNA methylthiotransferase MtaB